MLSSSYLPVIATLVILEWLLSTDNALVLGNMVRVLPNKRDQKKALLYGLWGAVGFRALCIGAWNFISGYDWLLWMIQVLGGLYLGKMTFDHFLGKEGSESILEKIVNFLLKKLNIKSTGLIAVIVQVELMDIAFSSDSILAAFALSTNFWVLLIGAFLGILMMRGVAQVFIKLIEKVPEFEGTSFVLIGLIAVRMLVENLYHITGLFHWKTAPIVIGDVWFFGALLITFSGTFLVHLIKKQDSTVPAEK